MESRHFSFGQLAADFSAARMFFLQQDFASMDPCNYKELEQIFFDETCCARMSIHDTITAQASTKSRKIKEKFLLHGIYEIYLILIYYKLMNTYGLDRNSNPNHNPYIKVLLKFSQGLYNF
jgi:hypothetical protein